jgi:nucleoside-diphosphate-sugar epimerase
MRALLIGGTGPTGGHIVRGLLDRGHDVTILHRGVHESDSSVLESVRHIHADPHFRDKLEDGLRGLTFDLIIAAYGRVEIVADASADKCERFIAVGGTPVYRGMLDRRGVWPDGMALAAREDGDLGAVPGVAGQSQRHRFAEKIARAERAVWAHHNKDFLASCFRYSLVYGPSSIASFEWPVARRVLSGRTRILLPDGGLGIFSRCAARNAAQCVLLGVDAPAVASGQTYNCADDTQYSLAAWVRMVAAFLGRDIEIVSAPSALSVPSWELLPPGPVGSSHTLVSTAKVRSELGYRDVVEPRTALRDLVHDLRLRWDGDPMPPDCREEDAVIEAIDKVGEQLMQRFGWPNQPSDGFVHSYDHP